MLVYFYNPSSPEAEGDCQECEASLGFTLSHRTEIMGTFPRHNCFVRGDGALDFKQSQGNKVLLLSVFFFYLCIRVFAYVSICTQGARSGDDTGSLETGITDACKPPYGC